MSKNLLIIFDFVMLKQNKHFSSQRRLGLSGSKKIDCVIMKLFKMIFIGK